MKTGREQAQQLLDGLSNTTKEKFERVFMEMFEHNKPMQLAVVGAFSSGKSSLVNSLLGGQWLYTAQQEATSLPVFIQYSLDTEMKLVNENDEHIALDREQFSRVTTVAPEGASYATLGLNQDWLKDLILIDLPGLGSVSERNHAYTLAQIKMADVVVYLLSQRGPTAADLKMIKLIQSYGKHVLVAVSHWDEVEASIALGEKAPDLEQWLDIIKKETGYSGNLVTTSFNGLNQQRILDFIANAKESLDATRLTRFTSELRFALEEELEHNRAQQLASAELTEQQAQARHEELLSKRNQLLELREELYKKQSQEVKQTIGKLEKALDARKTVLAADLKANKDSMETWELYIEEGAQTLRLAIAASVNDAQNIMSQFGNINLPEQTVQDLNIRLPRVEPIEKNEFFEAASIAQIQADLERAKNQQGEYQDELATFHDLDLDIHNIEDQVNDLIRRRRQVEETEVPDIAVSVVNQSGSEFGRKVGSVFSTFAGLIPHPKAKAIALTVSAYSERVGSLFDREETVYQPDPEKQSELNNQLQNIQENINKLRDDLEQKNASLSEKEQTRLAKEQCEMEIGYLERSLQDLEQQLKSRIEDAEKESEEKQKELLDKFSQRSLRKWISQFESQVEGIVSCARKGLSTYWNVFLDEQLGARIHEIKELEKLIDLLPGEKAEHLKTLVDEEKKLVLALDQVA